MARQVRRSMFDRETKVKLRRLFRARKFLLPIRLENKVYGRAMPEEFISNMDRDERFKYELQKFHPLMAMVYEKTPEEFKRKKKTR